MKACVKKLKLGYFPSLKNADTSALTDETLFHVAAEKCDDLCRTCKISEDFSSGVADHCTSCHLTGDSILDLSGAKPTCVGALPDKSLMVVISNNKILGVSEEYSTYGGGDEDLIQDVTNENAQEESSTTENPGFGFGGCPTTDPNCTTPPTSTSAPATTEEDDPITKLVGTQPDVTTMTTQQRIEQNMPAYEWSEKLNQPLIIDILEEKGIEGIGHSQDREDSCIGSIGEDRKLRNADQDIITIAISCGVGCDDCVVSEFGGIQCITPASGKVVAEGVVLDDCPTPGWVKTGTKCTPCPVGVSGRCPECEFQTIQNQEVLTCINCPAGTTEEQVTIAPHPTYTTCSPTTQ